MPDSNKSISVEMKEEGVRKINALRKKNNMPPITGTEIQNEIEQALTKSFSSVQK